VTLVGRELTFRGVDPHGDVDLLHTWLHADHVRPWWDDVAAAPAQLTAYLATQTGGGHSRASIVELGGRPIGYVEVYWAARDLLAACYDAGEYDQGIHVLLGPPEIQGQGIGPALLDVLATRLLAAEPATERIVAEPDARNIRAHRAFARAGFEARAEIALPGKRALFMVRERDNGGRDA
jgi:acetyl CoA:N6-hydroxylysine acetyl transferase